MKIFSAEQLYEADKITAEKQNISSLDLMERAGEQIFKWLEDKMKGAQVPLHIFCGIGNNGGDGLVVGRHLINHGYNVTIYIANFTDKRSKCFLINYDRIKDVSKKWPVLMTSEEDFPEIAAEDIIIDALFGIGLNRPPEGWVKELIQYINKQKAFKLSIDIPSGLPANTPVPDSEAVIHANHTLTFQAPKLAFFLPETGVYVPYFEVLDIGLDRQFLMESKPLAQTISKMEAQQFYKPRAKYDHKGTYGHALIVAGSYGKMGAAILSTRATLKAGAGMVTVFSPECGYSILQTAAPEAMVLSDDEEDFITKIEYQFDASAIGVGMGIGTQKETVAALHKLFSEAKAPLVIDADALNGISEDKDLLKVVPKNSVLTPHPGELERLIGSWKNDYEKIEKARKFTKKHKVVLLIKGAHSLILFEDSMYINTSGTPGMATAGSGDVLSGVITGLLSQGYDPLLATVFGVYLHGSAGMLASSVLSYEGVMASDIADFIGDAYIELFRQEQPPAQG
ncbi:NAD(P)H-hydrate dehydratase [Constantimarinum furrinae]|uniref:Bifunctional NAD(P)H-hydrate repair enzyme n=1 Tax=Constantimarinum furrinae TaxID=2562285 RepID=A0A7G8PWX7_9FLAO|nr:NAD(P)H-hydrate dehydratase [Constantimarinum furrinae]QNJ98843.1 ADP-dependent NAD(P)H-hydrate dehydratase [Constantimarinum furrinae]